MANNSLKALAALALVGSTSVLSLAAAPAKADLFCWWWEKNCKVDGKIGTSGNDILGLPGGDTITKLGIAADTFLGTGGAISGGIQTYYQPYKRQILDAVGNQLIAPQAPPQTNYGYPQGLPVASPGFQTIPGGFPSINPGYNPMPGAGFPQINAGYNPMPGAGFPAVAYPQPSAGNPYAPAPYQPRF